MNNMDLLIDEQLLNQFIKDTDDGGHLAHKALHALLKDMAMLGYLYRDEHTITLVNNKVTAEDDEEYQKYLDQRASWRQKVNWEDMEHDSD